MSKGYFAPVLHSHLPFVKHPEYDYFLEEHWLFEAITECYIPLLQNLYALHKEGVPFALTVSVTPPLAQMLSDTHLMDKYVAHLNRQLELAQKELQRTKDSDEHKLACFYQQLYSDTKDFFVHTLDKSVLSGYKKMSDLGYLEIITCGATHGFLPLLSVNEQAVRVQIEVAVQAHQKHFGKKPRGIWLPECAYYEGLDKLLSDAGIEFFFVDTHGLIYSKPASSYGVYAPCYSKHQVAAFARDGESSKQVWSSKEGYPGDVVYRDFYRDIGYDLDFEYIKDYIDPDGSRVFTGFKYRAITGQSAHKQLYDPAAAAQKVQQHAKHFHFNREKQIDHLANHMDRKPLIVSPYDAELFGHWWFEGPKFLYHLFKQLHQHGVIEPVTPVQYLQRYPQNQVVEVAPSSWGDKGYYDVWLNGGNDWIYMHLHYMADTMAELASRYRDSADFHTTKVLNQMAKELLLAQSSDWAFLMTTDTAREYSVHRSKEHISNFNRLHTMLHEGMDLDALEYMETKNSVFNFLDFRVFVR